LRQFSDAMQTIGRLESQLASIAGPQKERFGQEDFVDSPVPAREARGNTTATVAQTNGSANSSQIDENDRLRRKVTAMTNELALVKDQLKALKEHRRRRARREQSVPWWLALPRRLGLSHPPRERSGLLD
jgi:hypothetical protein